MAKIDDEIVLEIVMRLVVSHERVATAMEAIQNELSLPRLLAAKEAAEFEERMKAAVGESEDGQA